MVEGPVPKTLLAVFLLSIITNGVSLLGLEPALQGYSDGYYFGLLLINKTITFLGYFMRRIEYGFLDITIKRNPNLIKAACKSV